MKSSKPNRNCIFLAWGEERSGRARFNEARRTRALGEAVKKGKIESKRAKEDWVFWKLENEARENR